MSFPQPGMSRSNTMSVDHSLRDDEVDGTVAPDEEADGKFKGTHFRSKPRKKAKEMPPDAHKVSFSVTISFAIPVDLYEGEHDEDESIAAENVSRAQSGSEKKRTKNLGESPKPFAYYSFQYHLLPTDPDPVKTDVVFYGVAAKIYPEAHEAKVVKTFQEDGLTWVAWTHSHSLWVTDDVLKSLIDHTIEVRVWNSREHLSAKARFDKVRAFRLPAPKTDTSIF